MSASPVEPAAVVSAATPAAPASARARLRGALGKLGIGSEAKDTLRAHALRGSIVNVLDFGARQVLGLVSNLFLAALLTPAVFGVMALVQVVIRGLKMFSDVGIGPSIIQHKRGNDPVFLNTAWTIQSLRGFGLWIGACALAWPAAQLYDAPELTWVLPAAAFSSVIAGFNATALFTLSRKLAWAPMVVIGLTAQVVSLAVMVVLAWWWRSVWAIVAGGIVSALITAVGTHMIRGQHAHRFTWDREAAHDLFRFGKWVFFGSMLGFLAGQVDRLMLGKLITLDDLGVYSLALSVVMVPSAVCGHLSMAVLFPALASSARERPGELGAKTRAARTVILAGCLLVTVGVAVGAPILFEYLYDARYADAAWMAQGLSVGAWFTILQLSADRAVLALGDSRSLVVSGVVKLVVGAATSLAGFYALGIGGFVLGMAVGCLAGHLVVVRVLWGHGVKIVDQDVKFTALALLIGGAGVAAPHVLVYPPHTPAHLAVLIGSAVVTLGPLTLWAGKRMHREVFAR